MQGTPERTHPTTGQPEDTPRPVGPSPRGKDTQLFTFDNVFNAGQDHIGARGGKAKDTPLLNPPFDRRPGSYEGEAPKNGPN